MFTSAFESYSGDRQYREDVARAEAEVGSGMQFDKFGPYYATDGFIQANVDALEAALDQLPDARVVFVTHSIPTAMQDASGPGPESLRYVAQHRWLADQVIARVADHRGIARDYDLVYCSRSGSPHTPWLEPDVNDHLQALAADGVTDVVVAPIGFITDHMEVVFDLDTEAKQTAADLGLGYVRAATAGTHPAFVASLVDAMVDRAAIARGERPAPVDDPGRSPADPWPVDHLTCCLPTPGADPAPAICSA